MIRFLRHLLRGSEIQACIGVARCYNRMGVACLMRSKEACTGWESAWAMTARLYFSKRDAHMWEARQLSR